MYDKGGLFGPSRIQSQNKCMPCKLCSCIVGVADVGAKGFDSPFEYQEH